MLPFSRAVPALTLAALVCAAPARPAPRHAAARADTAMVAARAALAARLAATRPDLRAGGPAGDPLPPYREDQMADDRAWLEAYLARLDAQPASPARDSLRALAARALGDVQPDGRLRRDPLAWVERAVASVRAALDQRLPNACERTRRATRRLVAMPEFLRSGSLALRAAPPPDAAFDDGLAAALDSLRVALPRRTSACHEPRTIADFVQADTLAQRALAEFAARLPRAAAGDSSR